MITQFYTPLRVSNHQCKFNVNEYAYNLRTKRYHEILALLAPGMIRQFKNQQGHGKVLELQNDSKCQHNETLRFTCRTQDISFLFSSSVATYY